MSTAQREFITTTAPFPCITAGWNSGKSYSLVYALLSRHMLMPGITTGYFGNGETFLKKVPKIEFQKAFETLGWTKFVEPTGRPLGFNMGKYGRVELNSYHDPDNIRGYPLAHAAVDELDSMNYDKAELVFSQIIGRVRGIVGAQIFTAGTPDRGLGGYMYDRWGNPMNQNDSYPRIRSRTADNIYIPGQDEFIERVKMNYEGDPALIELFLEGEFVPLGTGFVYREFYEKNMQQVLQPYDDSKPLDRIYIGMDFNAGSCYSCLAKWNHKSLHFFDEIWAGTTKELAMKITQSYPGTVLNVAPDASGSQRHTNATETDLSILAEHRLNNINEHEYNPRVRDRIDTINLGLANSRIIIDPERCPFLIEALQRQEYDKDGEPFKHKGPKRPEQGALDDRMDAMGYLCFRLIGVGRASISSGRVFYGR